MNEILNKIDKLICRPSISGTAVELALREIKKDIVEKLDNKTQTNKEMEK